MNSHSHFTASKPHIGICQWCLPDRGPEGLILAKSLGYEGVEMDLGLGNPEYDLRKPELLARFVQSAKEAGILTPSLALNWFLMNDANTELQTHEIIDAALEVAKALSSTTLQLCSFGDSGIRNEEEFAVRVKTLSYACKWAESYRIMIGSENQLDTAENLRLIDAVGADNFAVYFDTANPMMLDDRDGVLMLDALYDHICELHIKDYLLDGSKRCVPLGDGDCGFRESVEILRERQYENWIVVENELPAEKLKSDATLLAQLFHL